MEKQNSVEVGEVSEINEEDVGQQLLPQNFFESTNKTSFGRGTVHRGAVQEAQEED